MNLSKIPEAALAGAINEGVDSLNKLFAECHNRGFTVDANVEEHRHRSVQSRTDGQLVTLAVSITKVIGG